MGDRITDHTQNRPYSRDRDRDQRMPTFHMLLDHDKHHHEYHFHHQPKREDHRKGVAQPEVHRGHTSRSKKHTKPAESAANFDKGNNNINTGRRPTTPRSPRATTALGDSLVNNNAPVPLVHKKRTSDESVSSVNSSRGPACNFSQFYVNKVEVDMPLPPVKEKQRDRSRDKQKGRRKSPANYEDEDILEDAPDVLVWNASKKTSRSNILCPLTDSEQWDMALQNLEKGVRRKIERERRARSSSIPKSVLPQVHQQHHHHETHDHHQQAHQQHHHYHNLEITNSLLFNSEDMGHIELLEDCLPPPIRETSSTLGDDISKMSNENEKLRDEVEHYRNQNESLLKVVQEQTEELERMKQIFRSRAISLARPDSREEEQHHHHHNHQNHGERERRRSSSPSHGQPEGDEGRKVEKHRSRNNRSRSKEKAGAGGNSDNASIVSGAAKEASSPRHSRNHSHSHSPHEKKRGSGEAPIDLNQNSADSTSLSSKRRHRKKVMEEDSDNEDEKMKHGCYMGLGISLNAEEDENSNTNSRHDSYDGDRRRRRRRSGSGEKRGGDNGAPQTWEEDILRRSRSHNKLLMSENNGNFGRRESKRGMSPKRNQPQFPPSQIPCPQQRPRAGEEGCCSRMFSCCLPKPAYDKDCEDDINILPDCPE